MSVEVLARLGPSGVDRSSKRCRSVSNLTLPLGEFNGKLLEPLRLVPVPVPVVPLFEARLELMGSVREVRHGRFLAGRLDELAEGFFDFDEEAMERGR